MASTDAGMFAVKGKAYRITFTLRDSAGAPDTAATSLDSEVSKDAGTFADCTNEATEIATASGTYYLDLTASEMDAYTVAVQVKSGSALVYDRVITPLVFTEPSAVPDFTTLSLEEILTWLFALSRNKKTNTFNGTTGTLTLRNDADAGNIATATVSESGGTTTTAEWS